MVVEMTSCPGVGRIESIGESVGVKKGCMTEVFGLSEGVEPVVDNGGTVVVLAWAVRVKL